MSQYKPTKQNDAPESLDLKFTNVEEAIVRGYRRLAFAQTENDTYRLKGLRADLVEDGECLDMLVSEYYRLSEIDNEHVPRPVGVMDDSPIGPALVVYAVNCTLLQQFMSQPRARTTRQELAHAIVKAMADIHRQDNLHGDIRPENIYVVPLNLEPWLANLALLDNDAYKRYITERPIDEFTPPEYSREYAPTQQSDVYSLGRLLSYLGLDKEYGSVIRRATHESPEKRYKSAVEMLQAMDDITKRPRRIALWLIAFAIIVMSLLIYFFALRPPLPSYNGAAEKLPPRTTTTP